MLIDANSTRTRISSGARDEIVYRITLNGGGDSLTLGGHFLLSGPHSTLILDLLPPLIHIRKESIDPAIPGLRVRERL